MMPEDNAAPARRDPTAERQERDAFLLHALAFERDHASLLIDHLVMCGLVRCRAEGGLFITSSESA